MKGISLFLAIAALIMTNGAGIAQVQTRQASLPANDQIKGRTLIELLKRAASTDSLILTENNYYTTETIIAPKKLRLRITDISQDDCALQFTISTRDQDTAVSMMASPIEPRENQPIGVPTPRSEPTVARVSAFTTRVALNLGDLDDASVLLEPYKPNDKLSVLILKTAGSQPTISKLFTTGQNSDKQLTSETKLLVQRRHSSELQSAFQIAIRTCRQPK